MSGLTHTSLDHDVSFLLARASALAVSAANAALTTHRLRVRSYSVLTIAAEGNRPTQRELAAYLQLDPSQVVAIVDELEDRGLVRRSPDPDDRRVKVVIATEEGIRVQADARASAAEAERLVHTGVDENDLPQIVALLRTLAFPAPATS